MEMSPEMDNCQEFGELPVLVVYWSARAALAFPGDLLNLFFCDS